jgi:DNA-binding LacI/PurR family transcriptional regulator
MLTAHQPMGAWGTGRYGSPTRGRHGAAYALNGRPGVSDEVRERIVTIAREVGFTANEPARIMHGGAVRAVGLTMRRPAAAAFSVEVFRRELISGIQAELMMHGMGLALRFVGDGDEEIEVYRRWSAERRVGGVVVCDLEVGDPRVDVLATLRLPAVVVGGPVPGGRLTSLWCDDASAVRSSVDHLAELGHRRVVRVSGPSAMLHTAVRGKAFMARCKSRGVHATIVEADYTGEMGAKVTRRVLSAARQRPTAIVYDNDVMAVAAGRRRWGAAEALSIVAWEDSPGQAVRPALTVVRRDIVGLGQHAARLLLEAIAGEPPRDVQDQTPSLTVRASTGPI